MARSWILALTRSPLAPHPITGSHYLKLGLLHQNRAPLPKNECPHVSLVKTEPRRLCFAFWLQLSPPPRIARSHHPTTSNAVYACQMGFPLPENEPPHIALAKTEPQRLGFGLSLQLSPPHALPERTTPPPQTQCMFAKLKTDPPNIALAKTKPWRLGFGIWLQPGPPPPCALPDPTPPLISTRTRFVANEGALGGCHCGIRSQIEQRIAK